MAARQSSLGPTAHARGLDRARLDGVEIEYEIRGTGEPVVLVHNGAGPDWFAPLAAEPALADRYRRLTYHRAGYAGSGPVPAPLTLGGEAARCRALLRPRGIGRAHVVGHSSSGNLALQLALDAPEAVRSLVLLEPALVTAAPSAPQVPQALALYRAGDRAGAVDLFLQGTCGPDYRAALERAIPGALDQAVAGADTFFAAELPALREWRFGPEEARRVTQPVLAVVGERTDPVHRQRWDLLIGWLPHAEPFVLPGATHLLHLENPRGMAEGMAAFLARHPLAARG
jgi:pimeloyl-ACP methyl ester carboxylesterase